MCIFTTCCALDYGSSSAEISGLEFCSGTTPAVEVPGWGGASCEDFFLFDFLPLPLSLCVVGMEGLHWCNCGSVDPAFHVEVSSECLQLLYVLVHFVMSACQHFSGPLSSVDLPFNLSSDFVNCLLIFLQNCLHGKVG